MNLKHKFFAGAVVKDDTLTDRQIRVVVSTPSPDRVKDVMEPGGCDIENYKLNPIVLADHNTKTAIGTSAIEIKSDQVQAVITFAPPGVSSKADEYCGLAKAGILNTVSPGFREIDASPIKGGGVHIKKWELLELSLVAVPANPDAVVIGRSLEKADANWKVGASRNLPIGEGDEWDGDAAKQSVFDKAGFDGEDPDTGFARKAFLVYDAANPDLKGSYKLPFAKVEDGRLVAMPGGLRNAASRLPQTDIPDDVAEKARAVLDHYEAKMKDKEGKAASGIKTKTFDFKRKDLYDCGNLSCVVQQLVNLALGADFERDMEGDDSPLPEVLAAIARQAGEALVAMVGEEVSELVERLGDLSDEQKAFIADGKSVSVKALRLAEVGAKIKAGRKFSAATAKALGDHADKLDEHAKGLKAQSAKIKSMLEDNTADTADNETAETDTGKALPLNIREREIEMLGLKSV